MAEKAKNSIRCSICNTAFECGANTHDCWCSKLPPLMPVEGESCWCPNCLAAKMKAQEHSGKLEKE